MSSKNKKIVHAGPRHRPPVSRAQLFPKKVLRELMTWDLHTAYARQQIEKAFPDPVERLAYLNSLIEAMDEPSREHPEGAHAHQGGNEQCDCCATDQRQEASER